MSILAKKVKSEIIWILNSWIFYTKFDTSEDVAKKTQLSQVFKYMTFSEKSIRITKMKVLWFKAVEDQTAGGTEEVNFESSIM